MFINRHMSESLDRYLTTPPEDRFGDDETPVKEKTVKLKCHLCRRKVKALYTISERKHYYCFKCCERLVKNAPTRRKAKVY